MSKISIRKHLRELQWRLVIVAAFFLTAAIIAYFFQVEIITLLLAPIGDERLIYLNPAGGFSFIFLIATYSGFAVAFPILMQQAYLFMRPALPVKVRGKSLRILVASLLLLIAGITFGYFIAVPGALAFLYGFADAYIDASLTADSYLNFIVAYTIGVGIVFQLPLLLLLIHSISPISPRGLLQSEKWVILAAFILAAIVTPTPDPINQSIIAVPIIIVYQLGVIAILISIYRQRRYNKKQAKHQAKLRVTAEKESLKDTPLSQNSVESMPSSVTQSKIDSRTLRPHSFTTLTDVKPPIAIAERRAIQRQRIINQPRLSTRDSIRRSIPPSR